MLLEMFNHFLSRMKNLFLNIGFTLLIVIILCSCNNKKFHVKGTITEAEDSIVYLENMSLDGVVKVDSTKLKSNGNFAFQKKAPQAPEFYRLRIDNKIINLSVDSTETILIKASYPTMATDYTVEGSKECNLIKELTLKQMELQRRAIEVENDKTLSYSASNDSISRMVERYKEEISKNYIYVAPMRASSYFALFQTLLGMLIFDPSINEDDIKVYGAVATSWDVYYPNALRGENLHNIAIEGMKNVRIARANRINREIDAQKVNVSNIIDISLSDNKGNPRSLTDLKGKVILLDFHIFSTKESTQRIMQLRDLYNKYHSKGLEIYQVSLDTDEHFWKTQTAALPWICVLDPEGINSSNIISYNVEKIPTFFLIGRDNALYKRDSQIENLENEIEKLL